jgi:hypothetical protein
MKLLIASVLTVPAALLLAGCGSSKHAAPATTTTTSTSATATASTTPASPGALQAEARSAATGDIPDNQAFVRFADPRGGYSIKYPEGWAQSGGGRLVVIRDKNNIVRVVIQDGGLPTSSTVRKQVAALAGARIAAPPVRLTLAGGAAIKVVYSTESAQNPVTGKRVTLVVDRYYLSRAGKEATIDLGTPQGVDNVDAYRLMVNSFRWR